MGPEAGVRYSRFRRCMFLNTSGNNKTQRADRKEI
jgi:hypothetical protein